MNQQKLHETLRTYGALLKEADELEKPLKRMFFLEVILMIISIVTLTAVAYGEARPEWLWIIVGLLFATIGGVIFPIIIVARINKAFDHRIEATRLLSESGLLPPPTQITITSTGVQYRSLNKEES